MSAKQSFDNTTIAHVIPHPIAGGAELLVREMTYRLRDKGVDARAIYYTNPNQVPLYDYEYDLGLKSARSVRAVSKLRKILGPISQERNLIVHAHLTWPLYHVPLATLGLACTLIYTEHNTTNQRRHIPSFNRFERIVYSRYREVVCISTGVQEALVDWLGLPSNKHSHYPVIWNGARLFDYKESRRKRSQRWRLVSVGSLSEQKGFEVAIKAVGGLHELVEEYIIVGEGDRRSELTQLVDLYGLQDIVRLVGWQDDVAHYLHQADICVIPSKWEGFGLVAVEALSAGLPVVASDVPGLQEVLSGCEAAVMVPPCDSIALRKGIESAISLLQMQPSLRQAARRRAERFTLSTMTCRYKKLYQQYL